MEWHRRIEQRLATLLEHATHWKTIMATLQDVLATETAIKDDIARVAGIVTALEAEVAALKAASPAQADIDAAAAASAANQAALDAIKAPAT